MYWLRVRDAAHGLSLHAAVLLFGVAGLFGKWLALSPESIVLGRTAVASVALAALLRVLREPSGGFEWRLAAGGAVLALHWIASSARCRCRASPSACLGYASFPLFVLIVEGDIPATPPAPRRLGHRRAGHYRPAVAGAGVPDRKPGRPGITAGECSPGSCSRCSRSATGPSYRGDLRPGSLCGRTRVLPPALCRGSVLDPVLPTPRDVALLIVLGVVCTALAHTLFIRSMRVLSAHTASVIAALEPVYGIALAYALLGEAPGWRTLIGAALIVGAALRTSSRADPGR